jgi:hypothetical protein
MPNWVIGFHPEFEGEFIDLPEAIQDELSARLGKLAEFGPDLGSGLIDQSQKATAAAIQIADK